MKNADLKSGEIAVFFTSVERSCNELSALVSTIAQVASNQLRHNLAALAAVLIRLSQSTGTRAVDYAVKPLKTALAAGACIESLSHVSTVADGGSTSRIKIWP